MPSSTSTLYVEIDQQAYFTSRLSQVGPELSEVHFGETFNRFDLHDHAGFNED
jgi:hypothetical protein